MTVSSIINNIRHRFEYGNILTKIILVNVAVFIFFGIFYLFCFLFQSSTPYNFLLRQLEVTASLKKLIYQPWSVFSYMFLHTGVLHVLFNMLWLYWFGQIFILYLGEKKILPLYICGGLAGALLYIIAYNVFPVFRSMLDNSYMLGASASVFAVVFASAAINSDHEISLLLIGPVKIKYVAIVSLLLDVFNIPFGNAGGYIAHVGGAIFGFAYIKSLQNGTDLFALFKPKPKVKVAYKNAEQKNKEESRTRSEQDRVDEILDKIARSGYDSLSKEEKDFLFHFSNR